MPRKDTEKRKQRGRRDQGSVLLHQEQGGRLQHGWMWRSRRRLTTDPGNRVV